MEKLVSSPLLNPNDPYRVSRKSSWVDIGGGGAKVNVEILAFAGPNDGGDPIDLLGSPVASVVVVVVTVDETDNLSVAFLLVLPLLQLLVLNLGRSSSVFSTSDKGLWVFGSMPLCLSFFLRHEFHKFFISLSVLPGNCAAI